MITEYGVNHPLAVKKWSMGIGHNILQEVYFSKFMGKGTNSLIQVKTELKKSPGDKITFGLRNLLTGDGISGDEILEGNEEALITNSDAIYINQLRHGVKSKGRMSEQRVPFSVREECRIGLKDWWTERMEQVFFNHLAGYTPETRLQYNGNNTILAPTTGRQLYTSVDHTSDQTLDSSDTFTLSTIDAAIEYARTAQPRMRPLKINGKDYFVLFLHEYCATDLRRETGTQGWWDIQRAAMEGGRVSGSPIFTTALGEYHGVILHRSSYLPYGVNSSTGAVVSNVRRNVLCGAQSMALAYGRDGGPTRYDWVEKKFDYDNRLGVASGAIFGMKKIQYTPDNGGAAFDYGTMVISSWAQPHSY